MLLALLAAAALAQTYPLTSTPLPSDGGAPISAAQERVQSVNGQGGAVVVPGSIRASCSVSSFDSSGAGSCTYGSWVGGTAYSSAPDCYATISSSAAGYVYAEPTVTSGLKSVAITAAAALKLVNLSAGATTFWTAPPAGTVVTLFCRGQ